MYWDTQIELSAAEGYVYKLGAEGGLEETGGDWRELRKRTEPQYTRMRLDY